MDMEPDNNLGESSQSSTFGYTRDSLAVNNSTLHMPSCALCRTIITSDNDGGGDLEAINVCGDCKFLLMEDIEPTSPDRYPRMRRVSRRMFDSSESMESMFSQQFSQMINQARQNPSTVSEHDNNSVDGDGTARLERHLGSRSGSRRWRRGFSDTESDAFDSLYGESESNASLRRDRAAHGGEADTISYSAYGGDSDVSGDDQSFLENENFGHLNGGSDLDSDNDIDPMNAGLYQLNSEDDSDWEMEAEIEGHALESLMGGSHGSLASNGTSAYINWRRLSLSPRADRTFPLRRRERMTNFQEAHNNVDDFGDFGDYLDARGFGDLLDHLAETESSRRGAPPASVSFVNNLPRMIINDDKMVEGVTCAICKDSFTVGTVVNKLPCTHFYHPSCILPWLSARNTCPLCRYELPTDDKDYEARKRNAGNENQTFHIHQPSLNAVLDEPSQVNNGGQQRELVDADSARENSTRDISRNRWFFLAAAAAPVVSLVGISLILWFGNPASGRLYRSGRLPYRRETSPRRWWSLF
ncbi:hypothetical protein ACS0TY_015561 [Phlomoides rotata]